MKECIIDDRMCRNCGECKLCDYNEDKVCDNCCSCVDEFDVDFAKIIIEKILVERDVK
jgi:hypothetical protein